MKKSFFLVTALMLLSSMVFGQQEATMNVYFTNYNPQVITTQQVAPHITISCTWTLANGTRYSNTTIVSQTPADGRMFYVPLQFPGTVLESFQVVKTCGKAIVNIPNIMNSSRAICGTEFIHSILLDNWVNNTDSELRYVFRH